mmetsp:Transcript_10368/g.23314  ORF Transcript_10368/g.23314 Transcript_10368/m.23314 type:complete len:123 (+) Transcript_10368:2-370(+)
MTSDIAGPFSATPVKTFMLGNLPYRATEADIVEAVDAMGFQGTYHISSFPKANKTKARTTNLGYAFISFTNSDSAAAFVDAFGSFHFAGRASVKQCTLKLARVQRKIPARTSTSAWHLSLQL